MRKIAKTALAVSLTLAGMATSQAASLAGTDVKISGYIKADGIFSNYSDGTLASGNLGRDFYVPALTPVGGVDEGTQFDGHIRQTRFRFTTNTDLENGESITGVMEFDFMVTPGGNDRISNSYTPRIRHAFLKYKNWLVGQTWSTFMDVGVLPESLDFIGVADGTIFDRQPMVRYTNGAFEFAAENPETTVTPFGGGGRIVADDNTIPDLIARYTFKGDWGHLKVAGMVRQLSYDNGTTIDDDETGYGISVTSKIKVGKSDDIRLQANFGGGLGRYLGLNTANGAVINANNELEAIDSFGWSVAYRKVWNEEWRSNFMYSAFSADNEVALTGSGVTKETYSARVNLLHSFTKEVTVGVEYAYAKREIESGLDGDMNRVQFSAKYAF